MIASFFDMSQVYGHVVEEVLNVYADFDGSGRRCSRRHAAGDEPVTFLNTRVKWLCSAKPVTSAISERSSESDSRSSWAFLIRAVSCHWWGDNPVDALNTRPNCDGESPAIADSSLSLTASDRCSMTYSVT